MRSWIIAGVVLCAGTAGAQDFGVSVDKFGKKVATFTSADLTARGCRSDGEINVCLFSDAADRARIYARYNQSNIVSRLQFSLPIATWAVSGRLIDEAQAALLIEAGEALSGAEITKGSKTIPGVVFTLRSRAISCSISVMQSSPDLVTGICDPK